MPFASAFPDPRLFPLQQLNRSLAQVSKTATAMSVIENLPPGNAELRHAIARRYAQQGMTISPDEIVITTGAMEALNLSLQAVTEPGDWVIVENPVLRGVAGPGAITSEGAFDCHRRKRGDRSHRAGAGVAGVPGKSLLANDKQPKSTGFYAQRREKRRVWLPCWKNTT